MFVAGPCVHCLIDRAFLSANQFVDSNGFHKGLHDIGRTVSVFINVISPKVVQKRITTTSEHVRTYFIKQDGAPCHSMSLSQTDRFRNNRLVFVPSLQLGRLCYCHPFACRNRAQQKKSLIMRLLLRGSILRPSTSRVYGLVS